MYKIIQEGKASIKIPTGKVSKKLPVFYNPMMKSNRDISVLLLNSINKKGMQIGLPLSASGVRGIRFLLELRKNKIKNIAFNDININAYKLIKQNFKLNKLINDKIKVYNKDANEFLLSLKGFDYIDIDPFGPPSDFLDRSVKRLARDGILAVTATDTGCLAGSFPKPCLRKYWAKPLKNEFMHETGLRILIRKAQLIASPYDKALTPIFSYSKDHYLRTFLVCEKGKQKVDKLLKEHGYVIYCNNCLYRKAVKDIFNKKSCPECNKELDYTGPLWLGGLWDSKLVKNMQKLNKNKELEQFLDIISKESKISQVSFYNIHNICKHYKIDPIPKKEELIKNIRKSNKCSETHFDALGIKSCINLKALINLIKRKT
ncbi:tRNA (guanine(10)-N(2))-dimethyltransferase [Candidatus Woesearchaeota archaeon]|nr:tRNA (guanine(10)-N(2))-dimethyltransferase [Candidatus Woesearchaeota archaeon]|tara:strand:- start:1820 stop:2941 length:1122 start_codon:yes stop_codon:yes gene_type:complete